MRLPENHQRDETDTELGNGILFAGSSALKSLVRCSIWKVRICEQIWPLHGNIAGNPVYLVKTTVYNASSQGLSRDMSFFHLSLRAAYRCSIGQIFKRRLSAREF